MPSPSLTYGGKMKILNTGTANFIVRDKRGNSVCLEPKQTVEVTDEKAFKIARVYSYIKIVEEKSVVKTEEKTEEVKEETKESTKVEVKEKKKKGKK